MFCICFGGKNYYTAIGTYRFKQAAIRSELDRTTLSGTANTMPVVSRPWPVPLELEDNMSLNGQHLEKSK